MSKLLFIPFRVLGARIAALVGKKLFAALWSLTDRREVPDPKQRDVPWRTVIAVLVLQGAIFNFVRGVVDRVLRQGFSKVTGSWPGEESAKES
jgi:Protein of unknown function (DUF4235)